MDYSQLGGGYTLASQRNQTGAVVITVSDVNGVVFTDTITDVEHFIGLDGQVLALTDEDFTLIDPSYLSNDVIYGGNGNDTIHATDGTNFLYGGDGDDTTTTFDLPIACANGSWDTIYGEAGNDIIDGGADDDILYGEQDADFIKGGAGNNTISGGSGDDHILGQGGNDIIGGDGGNDLIEGGAGNDTFAFGAADGNDTITDIASGDRLAFTTDDPDGIGAPVLTSAMVNGTEIVTVTFGATTVEMALTGELVFDTQRVDNAQTGLSTFTITAIDPNPRPVDDFVYITDTQFALIDVLGNDYQPLDTSLTLVSFQTVSAQAWRSHRIRPPATYHMILKASSPA